MIDNDRKAFLLEGRELFMRKIHGAVYKSAFSYAIRVYEEELARLG